MSVILPDAAWPTATPCEDFENLGIVPPLFSFSKLEHGDTVISFVFNARTNQRLDLVHRASGAGEFVKRPSIPLEVVNAGGAHHRPVDRGTSRVSAARKTRTFRPNYLSFSGSYQCNLSCAHCCVPIEWPDRLPIPVAIRFLEDAHEHGIRMLGLTGGEPFLYPEFVQAMVARAAAFGWRFDTIMSNGVWHDGPGHLESILGPLAEAGFTGKLGLSLDKFHGRETPKAAEFCRAARKVFRRDSIISVSYASRAPEEGLEAASRLADELGLIIEWSSLLGRRLMVGPDFTITVNWNHLAPVERAEKLSGAWDGCWFAEDYCEGPGQAFIVTPKGEVKPCCGFASDLDQLTIGNIHHDTVATIIRRARRHPVVGRIFRHGLSSIREQVERDHPGALPGKTSNHCFFCWYALTRGLVEGAAGHGGKVGAWK